MKTLALAASLALTAALVAAPLAAQGIGDMTEAERSTFRTEVRDYLLENPEVLIEAISVLEERQAQAEAVQDQSLVLSNAEAIFESPHDWEGGNPDGDIVLVEFMDYRCGYCRRAQPDVERLVSTDGNIRYIIKEFPILGEESVMASRFAISTLQTLGDDAYELVHVGLMQMRSDVTEDSLTRLAEGLGLDAEAVLAGMDSPDVDAVIAANHQLAGTLQISGTPTFVMNEELLRGYAPYEGMAAMVSEIRAEMN
ncbi:DsbA family protein [Rhodobacteraceae bacterium W635]|uniref:DsbA family protein n=1 Tax=Nioella halotolerans TaxID=2303578 RepID=UPI000E3BD445|nr:DsbA family protein [Rhodobacteraceae bacterium W635]